MTGTQEIRARFGYNKTGLSKYIAHLDTIDIICRAIRRLQLPYAVTQGCHVRPKISFGPPLPLGHSSLCEHFILSLTDGDLPESTATELSESLPQGMNITSIEMPFNEKKSENIGQKVQYNIYFDDETIANSSLEWLQNPENSFSATHKGKIRQYRLDGAVQSALLCDNNKTITAEFVQGKPGIPSVSRIITGLSKHLDEQKRHIVMIERVSLSDL